MTIGEHIRTEIFSKRLQRGQALVIYDPERRYREVALSMAGHGCEVLDASKSVIEQRELAMRALQRLGAGQLDDLVVWSPAKPPVTDDDHQQDPFSVLAKVGAQFPVGDSDTYHSICRRAKPDHLPEIDRLFADGQAPSFEMVDALDKGGAWPRLKTTLGVESSKEILVALLAPRSAQMEALDKDATWVEEARDFVQRILGHTMKTKGKTRSSISEELWRVLLFSEFAFDLKGELPAALLTMARAGAEAQTLVYDVCDSLRKNTDHRDEYIRKAVEIENQFELAQHTKELAHLGVRDTFPCEERRYLQLLVDHALANQQDEARNIWETRKESIWCSYEGRLAEWTLAKQALDLLDVADRMSGITYPDLKSHIHGYAAQGKEVDRHQRALEQAYNAWVAESDHTGLDALVKQARSAYAKTVEGMQVEFVKHVQEEGWPATGADLLWNAQLFNTQVAPALEAGQRVAYILVDSLRYELGVEVEKLLSEKHKVKLHTVCAQLPTYTEVGMASLMPDADKQLRLEEQDGGLIATLGGESAGTPPTRFAYLKRTKGDLCMDVELDELLRNKNMKVDAGIRLLVVRTRDIDTLAHQGPHQIHTLIQPLLKQLIRGVSKLAELGFQQAVIATDHGFMLMHEQGAGDVAPKPPGTWLVQKARCLIGSGSEEVNNLLFPPTSLGIPSTQPHYAVPKTLVPYQRGISYFHEGLSLQECVLPCLSIELKPPASAKATKRQDIAITYRQGKSDRIASLRPVLDLFWLGSAAMFEEEQEIELTIEASDAKGNVVGVAGSGPSFNPATGGVKLRPGQAVHVGLNMDENFRGQFKVRVLDPSTNLLIAELPLKTAYLE